MSQRLALRELTAAASGGVSVLELSGPGALASAQRLSRRSDLGPGSLCYVRLYSNMDNNELLDEAMLWVSCAERVELHVHGSLPLVTRLRAELGLPDYCAPDTLEERAWELCSRAPCTAAARVFMDQAEGALRRELQGLLTISSAARLEGLKDLVERSQRLKHLLEPALVVLAGPVNAGKSTLFNLLVGRERVVTDAAQGTTRDVIRERALLGDFAIDLVDTAGLRELGEGAQGEIEREGQRLGAQLCDEAQVVLWLQPSGVAIETPMPNAALLVESRSSQARATPSGIQIDSLADPQGTSRVLHELLGRQLGLSGDLWHPGLAILFDSACLASAQQALGAGADQAHILESLLTR